MGKDLAPWPQHAQVPKLFREGLSDDECHDAINAVAKCFADARDKAFATVANVLMPYVPT